MTMNGTTSLIMWIINGLLALIIALVGFNANREYQRNDDQEKRIQIIERTCVKMDYISDDIKEIKTDLKKLMRGNP